GNGWQSDISSALRSCVYININGRSVPFESKYPSGKGSTIVFVIILVTGVKNHNFVTTDIHIDIWIGQFLEIDHAISHSRVSSAVTQSQILQNDRIILYQSNLIVHEIMRIEVVDRKFCSIKSSSARYFSVFKCAFYFDNRISFSY